MPEPIDANSIAQLVGAHQAALRLYAAQFADGGGWGDDCVQEAFMQLSARSSMPDHPKAWLYRAVRSRALNRKRSIARRAEREAVAGDRSASSSKQSKQQTDEQRQWISDSLNKLPSAQREIVVLRIWSALSWDEIADVTGQSSSNAHRCYVDALKTLKQMWDKENE